MALFLITIRTMHILQYDMVETDCRWWW